MAYVPGISKTTQGATGSGYIPGQITKEIASGSYVPGATRRKKLDLSSAEGLAGYAESMGLGEKAQEILNPTKKLSALQRLSKGLSAFNPAEAFLTGKEKGVGAGVLEYGKGLAQDIGSAITGTDYNPDRRFFKDVAEEAGIENKIAKFGIGFVGDVLLDPSTYFGGALARGVVKTASKGASTALKGVGKVAPEVEEGLRLAGTGLQDALGRAFKFGYKASKGAADDIMSFLSREQQAKMGLAASNLNRLGTGVLSKSQQEELALKLVAAKRAEFAAREAGTAIPAIEKSSDPVVQAAIEAQIQRTSGKPTGGATSFASKLGIENPYEVYFPFIKKEKLDGFVNQIGSANVRVGSQGYLKQFKNVLTDDAIELDPAKAFFTSEAQQVTDRMTSDFLTGFVKKYGRPLDDFPTTEAARAAGYDIIKTKGIFGKELGYVSKYDASLIKDAISPEFQSINMLAKATGFDAITSLFKRSVTGIFLPFHVRNYMSGIIQNYEALGPAALNPRNISIGQKIAYYMGAGKKIPSGTVELGGKNIKFKTLMKPFTERFSGDTFYTADFETALRAGKELKTVGKTFTKERALTTAKTLGLGQEAIPFKLGRAAGQFIEHQQKATAYITALGQGKSIPEALAFAERAGFDYRALTRFESQILRRLIPFYSFTRKNIGLQLSTLGENPQRINQIFRFFGNVGDTLTPEEKENLPDFIRESLGVKLEDTPEGLKQYISSFGTPIEAFTQLFGSNPVLRTISQMNPILKAPIEIGIGKDSFRQRDLKDVYDAKEYKNAPQIIKDLLDITPVEKDILEKGPNGKLRKVGTKTQYVADPERLLIARSLFTSRGVSYLDQVFGNDMQGFVKALKTTTGIKPQQIDIEMQKSIKETQKKRELEDLLLKRGGLQSFSSVYKRKE